MKKKKKEKIINNRLSILAYGSRFQVDFGEDSYGRLLSQPLRKRIEPLLPIINGTAQEILDSTCLENGKVPRRGNELALSRESIKNKSQQL